jgi:choline dehydrogenase
MCSCISCRRWWSITAARAQEERLHAARLRARPESTGTIRLKSEDPKEHPLIDANYLAAAKDLET